jgi:uncharacterized damage-inducible protein DinB
VDRIVDQIRFARSYTVQLLEDLEPASWFRRPAEGVTHIAWQVGHLATAEYFLALERVRGRRPEDAAVIDDAFVALFGRQSIPDPDPAKYPALETIRAVFDRVHEQTLRETPALDPAVLAEPLGRAHRVAKTKGAALIWSAQHELIHAGQIGLLRRLLGRPPQW